MWANRTPLFLNGDRDTKTKAEVGLFPTPWWIVFHVRTWVSRSVQKIS